jgi:hypothetical protein
MKEFPFFAEQLLQNVPFDFGTEEQQGDWREELLLGNALYLFTIGEFFPFN